MGFAEPLEKINITNIPIRHYGGEWYSRPIPDTPPLHRSRDDPPTPISRTRTTSVRQFQNIVRRFNNHIGPP